MNDKTLIDAIPAQLNLPDPSELYQRATDPSTVATLGALAGQSKLDPYQATIHHLRRQNASYRKIAKFLTDNGLPTSEGTVINWIKRNPVPIPSPYHSEK